MKFTLALLATAIVLAPTAAASPEDPDGEDWVAIAVAPEASKMTYGSAGSRERAVEIAMDECVSRSDGTRCVMATAIHYGCVAAALDPQTGSWAGGRGDTQEAATADALSKLSADASPVGGGHCSTPLTPP